MKRKRGNKKGKSKSLTSTATVAAAAAAANPVIESVEVSDHSSDDDSSGDNNNEDDSAMEVDKADTPSSTSNEQPLNVASFKPDGSVQKTVISYSRVRVRVKTSKTLGSDKPSQGGNPEKSGSLVGSDGQGAGHSEKMEDCANSLPDLRKADAGNSGTNAGSIKIKSSSLSSREMDGSSGDKNSNAGVEEGGGSPQQKEPQTPRHEYRYSKKELDGALMVIKKVMKMDAAEPFNVPVDPVALGIPDYFDIIDTPMDFGTICSNLERGVKYRNSEDVFKDVQYIWDNCSKYNSKGDYIVDLMKRVKKNFMKYWSASGLYPKVTQGTQDNESSPGKAHTKKHKKRHGRHHKSDCMCAVCILKRNKREREEENTQIVRGVDGFHGQDSKQEGSSPMGSLGGDNTSSNTDDSLDRDEDAEVQGKKEEITLDGSERHYSPMEVDCDNKEEKDETENETKLQKEGGSVTKEESQIAHESEHEPSGNTQHLMVGESAGIVETNGQRPDEENDLSLQRKQESQEKLQRAKLYQSLQFQNPNLLSLCGILFPDNRKSVWSGPHSLVKPEAASRKSAIHKAVEKILS